MNSPACDSQDNEDITNNRLEELIFLAVVVIVRRRAVKTHFQMFVDVKQTIDNEKCSTSS